MINLYKMVDDTFVNVWNQVHTRANANWIAQLQQQLSEAVPSYLLCTEAQAIDVRIAQSWLQSMVWQLRVRDIPMNSVNQDISMNLDFPIKISKDLLTMTHQFSQQAMEVNGPSLVSDISEPSSTFLRIPSIQHATVGPLYVPIAESLLPAVSARTSR